MPVDHYENFPVASLILPRALRAPVEAVYRFARTADDLADEGDASPAQRIAALAALRQGLAQAFSGQTADDPMLAALSAEARRWRLPEQPFHDLLDAFTQDVTVTRYADFDTLMDYCRRSANPIGRLLLRLYGAEDSDSLRRSDAICSALQLVNFWQDVSLDWAKARIYLPLEDCARFGVDAQNLPAAHASSSWRALMRFECERARAMLISGAPLARRLRGRIGFELRLIVEGGLRILERIDAVEGDVFSRRPVLAWPDWALVFARALRPRWRTA